MLFSLGYLVKVFLFYRGMRSELNAPAEKQVNVTITYLDGVCEIYKSNPAVSCSSNFTNDFSFK